MNILSMLARLEPALGGPAVTKQMNLSPQNRPTEFKTDRDINLVVGYNSSPRSQTALDLTLWIAHQTRLATGKQVIVQVVYVVNLTQECHLIPSFAPVSPRYGEPTPEWSPWEHEERALSRTTTAIAELPERKNTLQNCTTQRFEQADYILWQARHLAEEWRGSLKTHLRFGPIAEELKQVVLEESASLLVLGCESAAHPLAQRLSAQLPCTLLGIPTSCDPSE